MSVRVKVKATGIIRTITEANYNLNRAKYELLEPAQEAPKENPQEPEKEAAEPVVADDQPTERTGDDQVLTVETSGITEEEAVELAPLLTKKRPGRKPKQA